MDGQERESMITACLRYMRASGLPTPIPTTVAEYGSWREKASVPPEPDEDAEDAIRLRFRYVLGSNPGGTIFRISSANLFVT